MSKRRYILKVAAAAGLASMMVGAQPALAAPAGYNDTVDRVRTVGSDTTYFANQKLANLYNSSPGCSLTESSGFTQCLAATPPGPPVENYDHDEVTDAFPVGSGAGIKQVCGAPSGTLGADIARSSRDKSSSDCAGLTFRAFAKDAIVPIIFPSIGASPGSAGVTTLSRTQLQGIFVNCTITDWGQVGGVTGQRIIPFGTQSNSGTYASFKTYLGSDPNNCPNTTQPDVTNRVIFENNARPIADKGADVQGDSIYFMSVGRFNSAPFTRADGVFTSVEGTKPTSSNISDGTYPISRNLFNVHKTTASQATLAYVDWFCRTDHGSDPETGRNFDAEITSAIASTGFLRLSTCPTPPSSNT